MLIPVFDSEQLFPIEWLPRRDTLRGVTLQTDNQFFTTLVLPTQQICPNLFKLAKALPIKQIAFNTSSLLPMCFKEDINQRYFNVTFLLS